MLEKTAKSLLLQYLIVVPVLMLLYKGGNAIDTTANHFIFHQNYLSDLGRVFYFNNDYNNYWIYYSVTLILVAVGSFIFFVLMFRKLNIFSKLPVMFFAFISSLGYIGIAVFPVDKNLEYHIISGSLAFFSFYIAILLAFVFSRKTNSKTTNRLLILLIILLSVFLSIKLFAPSSKQNESILIMKVIAQKIMVFSQIIIAVLLLKLKKI